MCPRTKKPRRQLLQLNDFSISKLHIEKNDKPVNIAPFKAKVGYSVQQHKENNDLYKLNFSFDGSSLKSNNEIDFLVHSEMCGFFSFPDGYTVEEKESLIRVNGLTILYGILRGQIAMCTGSFPGGKITLPTLSMYEIVMKAEANLKKNQIKDSPVPLKAKKSKN
jgi:hypothetical protein